MQGLMIESILVHPYNLSRFARNTTSGPLVNDGIRRERKGKERMKETKRKIEWQGQGQGEQEKGKQSCHVCSDLNGQCVPSQKRHVPLVSLSAMVTF